MRGLNRKNIGFFILGLLVIVLAVLLGVATLLETRVEREKEAELKPFFPELKVESLNFIRFTKGEKKIELKRERDRWWVKLSEDRWFPVTPEDIRDVLDFFDDLAPAEVIAHGKDKLEKFELTDELALKVELAQSLEDKNPYRIYLGKTGPDFRSTYVVKPDADTIFLIADNKNSFFQREPKEWRDRYPFREKVDAVKKFTIESAKETLTLSRNEEGFWEFIYPGDIKADSETVRNFLSRITNLVSISLVDDGDAVEALKVPDFSITFELDGRKVTLSVSAETDSKRYVKNSELDQVYALSASTWIGIPRTIEEFKLKEEKKEEKKETKPEEKEEQAKEKEKSAEPSSAKNERKAGEQEQKKRNEKDTKRKMGK